MHTTLLVLLSLLSLVAYWCVGVAVSVLDARVRAWMDNHPRLKFNAPASKASKVALLWFLYIFYIAGFLLKWAFTGGVTVAHLELNYWLTTRKNNDPA